MKEAIKKAWWPLLLVGLTLLAPALALASSDPQVYSTFVALGIAVATFGGLATLGHALLMTHLAKKGDLDAHASLIGLRDRFYAMSKSIKLLTGARYLLHTILLLALDLTAYAALVFVSGAAAAVAYGLLERYFDNLRQTGYRSRAA